MCHGITSFYPMEFALYTDSGCLLWIPKQIDNYTLHANIGTGATGVVLDATDRRSGQDFAIKVMSWSDIEQRRMSHKIERELSIVPTLKHQYIAEFHEVFRVGDFVCVVSPNYRGGDLLSSIIDGHTSDAHTAKRLFWEICSAVQYLHERAISHNDIKPDNVMLDSIGHVKLIDFGFAKQTETAGDHEKSGTLAYAAPELLRPGTYRPDKADIWSLGILLYVLLEAKFPWPTIDDWVLARLIRQGNLTYETLGDLQARAIFRQMTALDPNERPTIEEVLRDPFFDELELQKPILPNLRADETEIEDVAILC
jgi:serine/threonine protein kinase